MLGSHLGDRFEQVNHGTDGLNDELDGHGLVWFSRQGGDVKDVSRDDGNRSWCRKAILDGEYGEKDEVQSRFGGVANVLCNGVVDLE